MYFALNETKVKIKDIRNKKKTQRLENSWIHLKNVNWGCKSKKQFSSWPSAFFEIVKGPPSGYNKECIFTVLSPFHLFAFCPLFIFLVFFKWWDSGWNIFLKTPTWDKWSFFTDLNHLNWQQNSRAISLWDKGACHCTKCILRQNSVFGYYS